MTKTLLIALSVALSLSACSRTQKVSETPPSLEYSKVVAQVDHEQMILMAGNRDAAQDIKDELLQNNYPVTILPRYGPENIVVYNNPSVQPVYTVNITTGEAVTHHGDQVEISLHKVR